MSCIEPVSVELQNQSQSESFLYRVRVQEGYDRSVASTVWYQVVDLRDFAGIRNTIEHGGKISYRYPNQEIKVSKSLLNSTFCIE